MLNCLIIGDSIAKGSADALRTALLDRCVVVARVGASTDWATRMSPPGSYMTATISSGTNDAAVPGLRWRLERLRSTVTAERVLWIIPYDPVAAATVEQVALAHRDLWVRLADLPGKRDRLHPASYWPLASTLRQAGFAGASTVTKEANPVDSEPRIASAPNPLSRQAMLIEAQH